MHPIGLYGVSSQGGRLTPSSAFMYSGLICSDGAYCFVSDREGEPVAFPAQGFNAFVLTYEAAPFTRHPQTILDVSRAICIIRENAGNWHTDKERIAVCSFSTGGHLAASLESSGKKNIFFKK